jgi:acyl carrier protein
MDSKEINNKIKTILSEFLGVDPEDISDSDDFIHDLHMKPTDISDFQTSLQENGLDAQKVDFSQLETVEDLVDALE